MEHMHLIPARVQYLAQSGADSGRYIVVHLMTCTWHQNAAVSVTTSSPARARLYAGHVMSSGISGNRNRSGRDGSEWYSV